MAVEFAYYSAIAFLIFILCLCWYLPGKLAYLDSFTGWKDLRIWSTVLIAIQIVLYSIF